MVLQSWDISPVHGTPLYPSSVSQAAPISQPVPRSLAAWAAGKEKGPGQLGHEAFRWMQHGIPRTWPGMWVCRSGAGSPDLALPEALLQAGPCLQRAGPSWEKPWASPARPFLLVPDPACSSLSCSDKGTRTGTRIGIRIGVAAAAGHRPGGCCLHRAAADQAPQVRARGWGSCPRAAPDSVGLGMPMNPGCPRHRQGQG